MQERIDQEIALLRSRFPELEYWPEGQWVRIPFYPLPEGWKRNSTEVAFQIPASYPAGPPYGIYVPAGLLFQGARPDNYNEPAPTQPPFPGSWGIFSWSTIDGQWRATADLSSGYNLMNWVRGFADRFHQGK
jgi:hypothetical protein